jgi:hypothetical protein
MMVLDAIHGISWVWSSVNPATLVQSWRKLVPDLEEDDLQGFPKEEISKSEILDMVCADHRVIRMNWAFSMTNTISGATKVRVKNKVGRIRIKFILP